eukprot:6177751-Pleurochrysis_carterae.AAC.8
MSRHSLRMLQKRTACERSSAGSAFKSLGDTTVSRCDRGHWCCRHGSFVDSSITFEAKYLRVCQPCRQHDPASGKAISKRLPVTLRMQQLN